MLPTTRPLITSCRRYCAVMDVPSQVPDDERRLDVRRLSVLILDDRVDRDRPRLAVDPLDHVPVPLPHKRPADFPRAGQFVVVRVELLVEGDEPVDPRFFREGGVDVLYVLRQ